jgi:hypothetical protein
MHLWVIGIDCVSFYDFSIAFWNRSHSVVIFFHFIVRIIANKKHPQSQCHNLTRILVYHLLSIFLSWVPCWDVRYVYLMWTMFDSSLPPVVCGCAHVYYVIYGWLCIVVFNTYFVVFLFCFSTTCVPYVASFSGLSIVYCPFGVL